MLRALIAPQHAPLALAALLLLLFPCFGHCNGQCKCLAHPDSSIHRPQRPLNIQKSAIFKGILGVCWHENFSLDETKKKHRTFFALIYAFLVHSVECPSLYVVRPSTPRFTIAVKMEEKASDVTRATAAYA